MQDSDTHAFCCKATTKQVVRVQIHKSKFQINQPFPVHRKHLCLFLSTVQKTLCAYTRTADICESSQRVFQQKLHRNNCQVKHTPTIFQLPIGLYFEGSHYRGKR